ncbi:PAAR domain-containing protein [Cellulophaga baltica]|uniref:PAAR domain-containing protein n=1 Tax=Cellulophaga baltica TaxID=76594 RepID=UPI00040571CD|nr:PAAR domain-containing protein [Cellulophaga baltica]
MPGPIATIGSMHVCPMCTGTTPHVGGPIVGPGTPNILINGKPAALMGDTCVCVGPPDVIAQGAPNVMFNGVPVACIGDMTAHGGAITVGEPNVIIGSAAPTPSITMAVNKIPFPEIASNTSNEEAIANQQLLREAAVDIEGEPRIFNLQWLKEEIILRSSKVLKEVTLRAHVQNIPEGGNVTINVKRYKENENENGEIITNENDIIEITGTVRNKMVEVVWQIEDTSQDEIT